MIEIPTSVIKAKGCFFVSLPLSVGLSVIVCRLLPYTFDCKHYGAAVFLFWICAAPNTMSGTLGTTAV